MAEGNLMKKFALYKRTGLRENEFDRQIDGQTSTIRVGLLTWSNIANNTLCKLLHCVNYCCNFLPLAW